jgi:hypothetical protein
MDPSSFSRVTLTAMRTAGIMMSRMAGMLGTIA